MTQQKASDTYNQKSPGADRGENNMYYYTINENGIDQIKQFLLKTIDTPVYRLTPDVLQAWASDAEFQIGEGNPPTIEVSEFDSITGCTETFTISDAGVDFHVAS